MTSVIVPAHDEAEVIDRCLRALLADAGPAEFQVIVVANGCNDDTAAFARAHGPDVTVVEIAVAGKVTALNAGDERATRFPRIYMDADVVLHTEDARALVRSLGQEGVHAAAPRACVVTDACSGLVATYYKVWSDLPVIRGGYVGCGVYAVDDVGHRRIAPFPDVIADDTYVRRSFSRSERAAPPCTSLVHAPRTLRAHLHRSLRGRAGNAQLAARAADLALVEDQTPGSARSLLPLLRRPSQWWSVASFIGITALSRLQGRMTPLEQVGWNRDASSRQSSPADG